MSDKERKGAPRGTVERARSDTFFSNFRDRVSSLNVGRLSWDTFGQFCSQNDPMLSRVLQGRSTVFLTIDEVADCFHVDPQTVYRMSPEELPRIKVGGQYRIPTAAVVMFVSVGIWHTQERDKEKQRSAMMSGDLSVLATDQDSIADYWNKYIENAFGELPQGARWSDVVGNQQVATIE